MGSGLLFWLCCLVLFRLNFCSCTKPKLYPYMSLLWKAYHQGSLPNQRVSWVQGQISVIFEWPHTAGTNIWIVLSVQGVVFFRKEEVKVCKMFSLAVSLSACVTRTGRRKVKGICQLWHLISSLIMTQTVLTRLKREAQCYSDCVF